MSRKPTRGLALSPLVWVLSLGACTSVLGIEDLHDGPRPLDTNGGDTSSGATQSTGGTNSTGSTGGTGTGGKTPSGGTDTTGGLGNGGAGNEPGGGADAGTPGGAAGAGTEAGAGGAGTPGGAVHGKVIDRWGVALADVTVQIGTQQVSTDSKGAFTVPDVTTTYDVSLLVGAATGWVYQGLTRRDPTLQVFAGQPEQYSYVEVTLNGAVLGASDQISLAAGTATGSAEDSDVGIDFPVTMDPAWDGNATTPSTIHALEWTKNASSQPTGYKAYASGALVLDANAQNDQPIALNLTPKAITSKAVTGSVTSTGTGTRTNSVFVRFNSGASIQVVGETPAAATFSYQVPTLADATISVAAMKGTLDGPLGLIHKDGLTPGAATGALAIPEPPTLLTPQPGASSVDDTTSFSFKSSADNAGTFVLVLHQIDSSPPQHLYVVTTQKKFTLPSVVDGAWSLAHAPSHNDPAVEYEWWVETHEHYATVDEMTGPGGFADEFSVNYTTPVAIHPTDGTYTYTAVYTFTTKNP